MKRFEEYIERNDLKDATHLEIKVYYTKGGPNFLSGGTTPRGFYVGVSPVTKNRGSISYIMFTGQRQLLMAANRYTDKQFDAAFEKSREVIPAMIERVVAENKAA